VGRRPDRLRLHVPYLSGTWTPTSLEVLLASLHLGLLLTLKPFPSQHVRCMHAPSKLRAAISWLTHRFVSELTPHVESGMSAMIAPCRASCTNPDP
jgi:hypothetical protein